MGVKVCATCRHWRRTVAGDECGAIEAMFDEGLRKRELPNGGALIDGGLVSNECPVHNENPRVPPIPRMSDELRTFIEGMSVSVDVSTGDHDAQHRYFGTVTEVMDDPTDKHGVTLLVQDAKPNFKPPSRAVGYRTERGQFYGSLRAMPSHEHATARKVYDLGVPAVDRSPDGVSVVQDQTFPPGAP